MIDRARPEARFERRDARNPPLPEIRWPEVTVRVSRIRGSGRSRAISRARGTGARGVSPRCVYMAFDAVMMGSRSISVAERPLCLIAR